MTAESLSQRWTTDPPSLRWLSGSVVVSYPPEYKQINEVQGRIPPKSFSPAFSGRKGNQVETTTVKHWKGNQVETTTVKQRSIRGSEVESTTIIKERTAWRERAIYRKKQALIRGLIDPEECYGWEGELSPKIFLKFIKGQITGLLSQCWVAQLFILYKDSWFILATQSTLAE